MRTNILSCFNILSCSISVCVCVCFDSTIYAACLPAALIKTLPLYYRTSWNRRHHVAMTRTGTKTRARTRIGAKQGLLETDGTSYSPLPPLPAASPDDPAAEFPQRFIIWCFGSFTSTILHKINTHTHTHLCTELHSDLPWYGVYFNFYIYVCVCLLKGCDVRLRVGLSSVVNWKNL